MSTLREEIIACVEGQVRDGDPKRDLSRLGTHAHAKPDGGYELTFRLGDDFTGFRGHFPGHPILPAFVQLLMAECAVCLHSPASVSLRRVERGKFLRPIGPNEPVTVCWQEQPREGHPPAKQGRWGPEDGLRCSFTLRVGTEKAAAFVLEFAAEEEHHA